MEQKDTFTVRIFIKTNCKNNEFLGFDKDKRCFVFRVKAPAFEGKANKELLKFLKELSVNARIIQGQTSHFKVLLVENNEKAASLFVPTL